MRQEQQFPDHNHEWEITGVRIEDFAAIASQDCQAHASYERGYEGEYVGVGPTCPANENIRHDPDYITVGDDTFYLDEDEDYRDVPRDSKFFDCLTDVEDEFRDGTLDAFNWRDRDGAAQAQAGDCYVNFGL
jgi:hypothetical protein